VLFEVQGLARAYRLPRTSLLRPPRVLTAVRDVSFELRSGETLGLVGESGSGKTTLLRLMLGLEQPDAGKVVYHGGSLRREVQVVFQDPASALDPRCGWPTSSWSRFASCASAATTPPGSQSC